MDGFGVHVIHERGSGPTPIPLRLLHGWPSSFVQMLDIIPMLADPAAHGGDPADPFDVVVASLPGYGFSDRPTEPGMAIGPIGELFHAPLTEGLGYDRYALLGSDLGAGVTAQVTLAHPDAVMGHHTGGTTPYPVQIPDDLSPAEQELVANARQ